MMKSVVRIISILVFLGFVASSLEAAISQDAPEFARYKIILERKPFGEKKAPVAPPPPPPGEQIMYFKDFKMVAIIKDDAGKIRVGFEKKGGKGKSAIFGFQYVGDDEDENGIRVMDADFEMEMALLKRGDEEVWLRMNEGVGSALPPGRPKVTTQKAFSTGSPSKGRPPAPVPSPKKSSSMSYKERLEARRKALQHRKVQPPNMTPGQIETHLREYNMEVIRKGQPALPIQLTAEEDAQLVKEGVLPALQ